MSRLSRYGPPLLALVPALTLMSCAGGREFRTERAAIEHFSQHRQEFERAVALFLELDTHTIDVPDAPSAGTEIALIGLARRLRVSSISGVPGVHPRDQQWIQFRLGGRYGMSTYGLIFVPEGRGPAFSEVTSDVTSPPKGELVRSIGNRWFYFDYD